MSPRRRSATRERPELTGRQRRELLDDAWPWIDPDVSGFDSEEERRRAWELNGERLTAEYIADHPGKRPEAWWHYSAPKGCSRREPRSTVAVREDGSTLAHESYNLAMAGMLTEDERRHLGLEAVEALEGAE